MTLAGVSADNASRITLELKIGKATAHTTRGAPARLQASINCASGEIMNYTLRWFNKTATHAPETMWLSHTPKVLLLPSSIVMDKLGSRIDPTETNLGCPGGAIKGLVCGLHLHGVGDDGVTIREPRNGSRRGSQIEMRLSAVDSG